MNKPETCEHGPASAASAAGNSAKLREALERLREWAALDLNENTYCEQKSGNYLKLIKGVLNIANAALAAPPRNCDVYDVKTAEKEFIRQTGSKSIRSKSVRWLYAPATEKEGGAK